MSIDSLGIERFRNRQFPVSQALARTGIAIVEELSLARVFQPDRPS